MFRVRKLQVCYSHSKRMPLSMSPCLWCASLALSLYLRFSLSLPLTCLVVCTKVFIGWVCSWLCLCAKVFVSAIIIFVGSWLAPSRLVGSPFTLRVSFFVLSSLSLSVLGGDDRKDVRFVVVVSKKCKCLVHGLWIML